MPAISRHECIESIGLPTSTVRTPRRAAVIGPIVEPQAMSLRVTNSWGSKPASLHRAAKKPEVAASLA